MNEKNYYSLRLLGTNAYHAKGDVLKTTNQVLNIGETADCEIRYESGPYEPERYATIVENEDGESWRLIQRSEHVKAQIAGSGGFGFVHQLKDGDVISFDGQDMELEFHTHHDSNYGNSGVVIELHTNKKNLYWGIGAFVLIISILAAIWHNLRPKDIKYEDIKVFESSVFLIRVDSVQWVAIGKGDTTLIQPTMTMDNGHIVGTAFLTTEGKLVTARHCIEYWIGEDLDDMPKSREPNDIRKWAILAETFMYMREHPDSSQMLRVFFSMHHPNHIGEPIFAFSSTDSCVHINRLHDAHLEFGDYENIYYWRSIKPTPNAPDRELGDIAYINVDTTGTIEMADSTMIASLTQSSSVGVLGLPGNLSGRNLKFMSGIITENRNDTLANINPDIQFDANITHGFSGGPVFIRANDKIVAAGVVSKIDTDNGIYKKAVPVTEIDYMIKRGKEGFEND